MKMTNGTVTRTVAENSVNLSLTKFKIAQHKLRTSYEKAAPGKWSTENIPPDSTTQFFEILDAAIKPERCSHNNIEVFIHIAPTSSLAV